MFYAFKRCFKSFSRIIHEIKSIVMPKSYKGKNSRFCCNKNNRNIEFSENISKRCCKAYARNKQLKKSKLTNGEDHTNCISIKDEATDQAVAKRKSSLSP
jgi:hypothetical protein